MSILDEIDEWLTEHDYELSNDNCSAAATALEESYGAKPEDITSEHLVTEFSENLLDETKDVTQDPEFLSSVAELGNLFNHVFKKTGVRPYTPRDIQRVIPLLAFMQVTDSLGYYPINVARLLENTDVLDVLEE